MSRRQEETVAYGSPDSPLSKMDVISVGKWIRRQYIYVVILVLILLSLSKIYYRCNLFGYIPKLDSAQKNLIIVLERTRLIVDKPAL